MKTTILKNLTKRKFIMKQLIRFGLAQRYITTRTESGVSYSIEGYIFGGNTKIITKDERYSKKVWK